MAWPPGAAVGVGVFLLLSAPAAQAGAAATVDSARLELPAGSMASAQLAGAIFQDAQCGGLSITGTVARLRIEVDRSDASGVPGLLMLGPARVSREDFEARDAVLTLSGPHPDCRVGAWLDPGMAATFTAPGGALALDPAPPLPVSYGSHINGTRPRVQVGGADLLRLQGEPGLAQVEGHLRLSVWQATLEVQAGNASFRAVLGDTQRRAAPAGLPLPVAETVETEAFLWLEGARLNWTLPAGTEVLAGSASVEVRGGAAQLHDALAPAGRIPRLSLESVRGTVHASGGRLVGSFEPVGEEGGGMAAPLLGPAGEAPALWIVGLLLALAVVGRRAALRVMRRALDDDAYANAARWAGLVWPPSAEARVARVVCLLRLGRLDAAERLLHPRRWRSHAATRSFLQARLEASRGDAAAARRHLADCFLLAPSFVEDARADLALHGIVEAVASAVRKRPHAAEGYA
ncbi:MAG TPA: hypothetical protein VHI93_02040 [Candidatus Thermoplasmatota archaeon]|nr:hypothetical protein [Candidatus Thermoplasmatota archaeon]